LCKLNEHGIPCGPINDLAQVFADPQVQHRKMQLDLPLEDHQTVPSVANPIRMSQSPVNYQHASPALGQHSRECLQQLTELDEAEIDRLVKSGVIA